MRCENLLLVLVVVVGGASACKYYCKVPNKNTYICCDDGNPFTDDTSEEVEEVTEPLTHHEYPTSSKGCVYYCAYEGSTYCCADTSVPIPESHKPHEGVCPEEGDQLCKSQGVFLYTKKAKTGRTSGSLLLAEGDGKQHASCASDGYCALEEKCCASHCARKHICLKSLTKEEDDK